MLEIQDPYQQALRYFQRIEDTFKELEISPTPLNYFVWYKFLQGDNPQFRQEMDALLQSNTPYTDRIGRRFYNTYLANQETSSPGLDQAFKKLLDNMAKRIQAWSQKLTIQTNELHACSQKLTSELSQDALQEVVSQVLTTADLMQANSADLNREILQNTSEIQLLRKQLMEARAEALKDELTELGNRKAFNLVLQEYIDDFNLHPQATPPGLILADIDFFKQFNDTFGHLVGDSVLRYFANILKSDATAEQLTCRYGGEEFAILFKSTDLQEIIAKAEEKRSKIEAARLKRKGSNDFLTTITASFGIAIYRQNETAESLIKRADDALYRAKKSGRNLVVSEDQL